MAETRASGPATAWLAGAVVLAFVVGAAVLLVLPLVPCPSCPPPETGEGCFCRGAGRTSRFRIWRARWGGAKIVSAVHTQGFIRQNGAMHVALTGIRRGDLLVRERTSHAVTALYGTGRFDQVRIAEDPDPADSGKVIVTICVREK